MPDPGPNPDEPIDPADAGGPPGGQVARDPGGPPPGPAAPKCTPAFRKALLARLPVLGYAAWDVKESIRLDDEWGAVVRVDADSVLEPLEAVVAHGPTPQGPPGGRGR